MDDLNKNTLEEKDKKPVYFAPKIVEKRELKVDLVTNIEETPSLPDEPPPPI